MKHQWNLRSTARSSRVRRGFAAAVLIFVVGLAAAPAHAQDAPATAFTYQGQLKDGGRPATGLHDLRFRLFDAAEGGRQVGETLCADDVDVVGGLFTVILDFDQQFATPEERHLEIEVRRDSRLNCDNPAGFVVLAPRQEITGAPLASHAVAAFALDAADGSPENAVFVDNDGKVGIGTTAPAAKLHVKGPIMAENVGDQADLLWLASERSWVFRQEGTEATTALKLQSVGGGGNKNFVIQTDGSVGIGNTSPFDAKLFVEGGSDHAGTFLNDAQLNPTIFARNIRAGGEAGLFLGDLSVGGDFFASGRKAFRIDHPLDPKNKYLLHFASESPSPQNFYSGNAVTDADGYAWVELPEYCAAVNTNFKYQLTIVDDADSNGFAQVKVSREVRGNRFQIGTSAPGTKVSWRVEADRNDPYVRARQLSDVVEKVGPARGTYLHPEFYGQPPEMGMNYRPELEHPEPKRSSPATSSERPSRE